MKRIAFAIWTRCALLLIYGACFALYALLGVVRWLVIHNPRTSVGWDQKCDLMVIGTFYTRNWCISHLTPLARASNVRRVIAIVDGPTHNIPGVTYPYPPKWLVRIIGRAFAKFLWALGIAIRIRPQLIMGYHLLPGGLTALLVARAIGARSGYQVTAGQIELIGGGAATENFFLKNLMTHSTVIEWLVCALARRFDLIVVRGRGARAYMIGRELGRVVCIVPGSIDIERLGARDADRDYDVVAVCRLVPIKQPDHMIEVISCLKKRRPDVRAIILGDGPMRDSLHRRADELGVSDNIEFRGHVENVESYLKRAKVFLLTSRSEGLSIAMAEAMAAGVVPVVADVGDLGDLVQNGKTGWLVTPGNYEQYAQRIGDLIGDPDVWATCSRAATDAAKKHNGSEQVAHRWAATIGDVCGRDDDALEAIRRRSAAVLGTSRHRMWQAIPPRVKSSMAPLIGHVPNAWVLGRRFQRVDRFVADAQWWPMERTREYQLRHLRRITQLAYDRSSYYRESFDAAGFDPRDLTSLELMAELPTIDQNTVRQSLDAMCVLSHRWMGVDAVSTGGTGGKPLKFYIGSERSANEYAYLIAGWKRAGYDLGLPLAMFRGEVVSEDRNGLRHEYDPLLKRHAYSAFHLTDDNMHLYLNHIATIGPCFLYGYPSTIAMLASFMNRAGVAMPKNINGVLAGSENVYEDQRRFIRRMFPVPFFSWYGHSEKLVMAAECEHSNDYHVWPTYGYFELLDDEGRPVTSPGQRGEIVGTGFINNVVPFIRYRTGDFATLVGDRCDSCGREHPIIREVRGHRTQELLVASDGTLISWTALNMHDATFDNVRQFQFRQTAPGSATLLVVPGKGFEQSDVHEIQRNLGAKMAGRIDFDVETRDSIPLSPGGKSVYVDQRIVDETRGPAVRNELCDSVPHT